MIFTDKKKNCSPDTHGHRYTTLGWYY